MSRKQSIESIGTEVTGPVEGGIPCGCVAPILLGLAGAILGGAMGLSAGAEVGEVYSQAAHNLKLLFMGFGGVGGTGVGFAISSFVGAWRRDR